MYVLLIQPEAKEDIYDSFDWYEKQRAGLGHEFLDEVDKGFLQLILNPDYYTFLSKNLRRYRIKRFPFLIIYGIDEKKVVIVGVRHLRRKPKS